MRTYIVLYHTGDINQHLLIFADSPWEAYEKCKVFDVYAIGKLQLDHMDINFAREIERYEEEAGTN